MAILDFIKNRQAQQQSKEQVAQPKPETARDMYARQGEQERTSSRPMDQMPPQQQAKVEEVKAEMQKATQHLDHQAPANAPAPADGTASPQPMRQNMMAQDKEAPAQSPTSAQLGQAANEKSASAPSREGQSQTRESSQQRAKTTARTSPSRER
jgi:hypothetical protein